MSDEPQNSLTQLSVNMITGHPSFVCRVLVEHWPDAEQPEKRIALGVRNTREDTLQLISSLMDCLASPTVIVSRKVH